MMDIHIEQLLPHFIMGDQNGRALACGIEAALKSMTATMENGVQLIAGFDTMPEWRLDEIAWENGSAYDYDGTIEQKREWAKNAVKYAAVYGTPMGLKRYLSAYFDTVEVREWWQYGGEPYHYRVIVGGRYDQARGEWLKNAVVDAENVRSVIDSAVVGSEAKINISDDRTVFTFDLPMAGQTYCGSWPMGVVE